MPHAAEPPATPLTSHDTVVVVEVDEFVRLTVAVMLSCPLTGTVVEAAEIETELIVVLELPPPHADRLRQPNTVSAATANAEEIFRKA